MPCVEPFCHMLRFLKGQSEPVYDPSSVSDRRVSFELHDDDIEGLKQKFQRKTFTISGVADIPPIPEADQTYTSWREEHPCILENIDKFYASVQNKRLAIFLDYDGTLTPIVSNPDEAIMSDEMRRTVKEVAQLFPTGIISGRGREKVESFVKLSELYYAGSHGMDIAGPQANTEDPNAIRFQPAASFAPLIDKVYHQLTERLKDIPGATVEHNKFCVSAHFRNCAAEDWGKVVGVVEETLKEHQGIKTTKGRKVLEIRPQVDWDKGRALDHLLQVLGLKSQPDVVAIYIGDDTTDEDAFRVLAATSSGFGILVSTKVKPTAAAYTLRDPAEVQRFLSLLVEWGKGSGNGWFRNPTCLGWKPAYQPTPPAGVGES